MVIAPVESMALIVPLARFATNSVSARAIASGTKKASNHHKIFLG